MSTEPENIVRAWFQCSECESESAFDGNCGEWCPHCRTHEHLVLREAIYRKVEIEFPPEGTAE